MNISDKEVEAARREAIARQDDALVEEIARCIYDKQYGAGAFNEERGFRIREHLGWPSGSFSKLFSDAGDAIAIARPILEARGAEEMREAAAKIAERMLVFADTTSRADREISAAIRTIPIDKLPEPARDETLRAAAEKMAEALEPFQFPTVNWGDRVDSMTLVIDPRWITNARIALAEWRRISKREPATDGFDGRGCA